MKKYLAILLLMFSINIIPFTKDNNKSCTVIEQAENADENLDVECHEENDYAIMPLKHDNGKL